MTHHVLPLDDTTLHGSFDRAISPAITVASGDSVRTSTLDPDWVTRLEPQADGARGPQWPGRRLGVDDGHALTGPVAVEGAVPGSVLEVRVDRLVPATWAWSRVGGRPVDHDVRLGVDDGEPLHLDWTLDAVRGSAVSHLGHSVPMRPFLGVIGMPPATPGAHSTHPPRRTGGNIDCKELTVGTSLFLPVEVPGGLVSFGDGHAAQGDGEVGSTAVECPMDVVEVTLTVHDDMGLQGPVARTATEWLTFGFSEDLAQAAYSALGAMVDLVQRQHAVGRKEALAMCSPVVDLRITQIVNGVCGVHAALPVGAVRKVAA